MFAQSDSSSLSKEGLVSFITNGSVYVKFESTKSMKQGDTIFTNTNGINAPAILIKNISSISIVGTRITDEVLTIGQKMIYFSQQETQEVQTDSINSPINIIQKSDPKPDGRIGDEKNLPLDVYTRESGYSGRLSFSTNAQQYDNGTLDNQSIRTSFSYRSSYENGPIAATEAYLIYRQRISNPDTTKTFFNNLRIYNLAISILPNPKNMIWIGRKVNQCVANIGAIDGIQYEHKFTSSLTAGSFFGSRPDYTNYGINFNLKQFGLFLNHQKSTSGRYIQSSFSVVNQMNGAFTDRRFMYFQHSNSITKSLNFFGSTEIDLFENINEQPKSTFHLTSVYLALRYKVLKQLALNAAYDNRKNVIYYETNKSYLEDLIDVATRQGLRLQATINPFKKVTLNITKFYRFQSNSPTTQNLNVSCYISKVPGVNGNLSLTATSFKTSYLESKIFGGRFSKGLFKSRLQLELSYRNIYYNYTNSENVIKQNAYGFNVNWQISPLIYMTVDFEQTSDLVKSNNRYFATITKRFKSPKKPIKKN